MTGRELVAWNLRRLRTARGLSQERLAADTGVDRAYVSEIENAQANPSVDLLDRLAGQLACELADLFRTPRSGDTVPEVLPSGRHKSGR